MVRKSAATKNFNEQDGVQKTANFLDFKGWDRKSFRDKILATPTLGFVT